MDCKAFRQESEELDTGESLSRSAQAHVNSCTGCRTFQAERLSLRQLVGQLGAVSAPPDFDFQLRARLAAAKSAGNHSFHRARFAPGLKAISVAAAFAVLIAGAIIFKQLQPVQSPQQVATKTAANAPAVNEAQTQNSDNASRQSTTAPKDDEAIVPVVATNASKDDGVANTKGGAEKTAQVKHARNPVAAQSNRSPLISNDIAFGGSPTVITPVRPSSTNAASDGEAANPTALLRVSSQPFKVVLHDRQGALRSVSLEPVVFGSQDFLGRAMQRQQPVSNIEGIW